MKETGKNLQMAMSFSTHAFCLSVLPFLAYERSRAAIGGRPCRDCCHVSRGEDFRELSQPFDVPTHQTAAEPFAKDVRHYQVWVFLPSLSGFSQVLSLRLNAGLFSRSCPISEMNQTRFFVKRMGCKGKCPCLGGGPCCFRLVSIKSIEKIHPKNKR